MLLCYNPHREVSIDEAMVGFKGRSALKQYMPMKSTKRGFKLWYGSDAHNGLAFSISIYAGASESSEGQGLGAAVVMKIAQPLLGKGHCLYYDNFFLSVELASNLLSHQTYIVSTTRTNRRGWPNSLRDSKKLNQELQRGEHKSVIVSTENGAVECLAWKDKKVVTMLNTDCNPNNTTNVKMKGRDGQSTSVSCPESVKMYNKFTGGVDLADAQRKTYSCSRR